MWQCICLALRPSQNAIHQYVDLKCLQVHEIDVLVQLTTNLCHHRLLLTTNTNINSAAIELMQRTNYGGDNHRQKSQLLIITAIVQLSAKSLNTTLWMISNVWGYTQEISVLVFCTVTNVKLMSTFLTYDLLTADRVQNADNWSTTERLKKIKKQQLWQQRGGDQIKPVCVQQCVLWNGSKTWYL